jgi:hypothetical protein
MRKHYCLLSYIQPTSDNIAKEKGRRDVACLPFLDTIFLPSKIETGMSSPEVLVEKFGNFSNASGVPLTVERDDYRGLVRGLNNKLFAGTSDNHVSRMKFVPVLPDNSKSDFSARLREMILHVDKKRDAFC